MSHFPSSWFHFTDHKEIQRLRQNVTETISFKIEISVAVILAIISAFFENDLACWPLGWRIAITLVICIVVFVLFNRQMIKHWFSDSIMLGVKQSVTIFDEEVVYDVMVAAEYLNNLNELKNKGTNSTLESHLITFHKSEIVYYIQKAQNELSKMCAESSIIFGEKNTQISLERVTNIISLIDTITKESGLTIIDVNDRYKTFLNIISAMKNK